MSATWFWIALGVVAVLLVIVVVGIWFYPRDNSF